MTDRPPPPPVLEYQTPPPRRPRTASLDVVIAFAIGVWTAMFAVVALDPHAPSQNIIDVPIAVMVLSSVLFVNADAVRRAVSKRHLRERAWPAVILTGVCCILTPTAVRAALLGRTQTLPWVAVIWFIAVVAAPFVVYPSVEPA